MGARRELGRPRRRQLDRREGRLLRHRQRRRRAAWAREEAVPFADRAKAAAPSPPSTAARWSPSTPSPRTTSSAARSSRAARRASPRPWPLSASPAAAPSASSPPPPACRSSLRASRATAEVVTWHGRALGAPATLILHHPDRAAAERLLAARAAEIDRLECDLQPLPPRLRPQPSSTAPAPSPPRRPSSSRILDDCRRFHAADRRRLRPDRPAALAPLRRPFRRRRRPRRPARRRPRRGPRPRRPRRRPRQPRPHRLRPARHGAHAERHRPGLDHRPHRRPAARRRRHLEPRRHGRNPRPRRQCRPRLAGRHRWHRPVLPLADRAPSPPPPPRLPLRSGGPLRPHHRPPDRSHPAPLRPRDRHGATAAATADALSTGLMLLDPASLADVFHPT